MNLLLPYFWLVCFGVMLVNVAICYRRAGHLIIAGRLTDNERRRFTRGAVISLAIFCGLFQAIMWFSGESSPLCLTSFPPNSLASVATWLVTSVAWIMLLRWVWSEEGANLLSRVAPAIPSGALLERTNTAAQVRWFVTAISRSWWNCCTIQSADHVYMWAIGVLSNNSLERIGEQLGGLE